MFQEVEEPDGDNSGDELMPPLQRDLKYAPIYESDENQPPLDRDLVYGSDKQAEEFRQSQNQPPPLARDLVYLYDEQADAFRDSETQLPPLARDLAYVSDEQADAFRDSVSGSQLPPLARDLVYVSDEQADAFRDSGAYQQPPLERDIPYAIPSVQAPSIDKVPQWQWEEKNSWQDEDVETSVALEDAFQSGTSSIELRVSERSFFFDLKNLIQTNKNTKFQRKIRRIERLQPSVHEDGAALMKVAKSGDVDGVTRLLDNLNANFQNKHGYTALMWASRSGQRDIVHLLLDAQAQVNLTNKAGSTALFWAACFGHAEIVKKLILNSADVNHTDLAGFSPLIYAGKTGRLEPANTLISSGADINHAEEFGDTALLSAARLGHYDVVRMLLEHPVNLLHTNKDGMTVFDCAVRCEKSPLEMIQILAKSFSYPEARFITYSKLDSIKELDSGEYGIVYKAKLNIGESVDGPCYIPVVCKVSKLDAGSNEWHELQTLQNIPLHPNVLGLLAMCTGFKVETAKRTAMIIIFKEGGSLLSHLKRRTTILPLKRRLQFALDMANGVAHLHNNGYKHCDIAARNFLMSEIELDLPETPNQCLSLTDFGLTRPVDFTPLPGGKVPILWSAPETLESSGLILNTATDVWMLGMTYFELSNAPYQRPLYCASTIALVKSLHKKGNVLNLPTNTERIWRELVELCCTRDPDLRITSHDLVNRLQEAISGIDDDDQHKGNNEPVVLLNSEPDVIVSSEYDNPDDLEDDETKYDEATNRDADKDDGEEVGDGEEPADYSQQSDLLDDDYVDMVKYYALSHEKGKPRDAQEENRGDENRDDLPPYKQMPDDRIAKHRDFFESGLFYESLYERDVLKEQVQLLQKNLKAFDRRIKKLEEELKHRNGSG